MNHTVRTVGSISLMVVAVAASALFASIKREPAVTIHKHPDYRPSVFQDFRARYPEPISVSPDGTKILLRTLNSEGNPFGLEIIESRSHRSLARIAFADDPMRLCWRPDGKSVSFFVQNRQKNGRSLHLWKFSAGRDDVIPTPPAKAEPNMKWSPSSRYFAYIEGGVGLVVIDSQQPRSVVHVQPGADYIFDWLADSRRIAYVPRGHPNAIRVIDLSGKVDQEIRLPEDNQLLDVVYSGARQEFLVITRTPADPFLVETVVPSPVRTRTIYRSTDELDYPHLVPDGRRCLVEIVKDGTRKIVALELAKSGISEIPAAAGDNQVDIVDPKSRFLIFTHRGSAPSIIYKHDFGAGKTAELYSKPSGPSVSAETHWVRSSDGVRVPLYVWRGEKAGAARAAVIRVHAFNVKETPTWQDEIQIMASRGVTYVACNYRGSLGFGFDFEKQGTPENQRKDVQATIEYVHKTLRIPYDRIVLLGYSAGADLALDTAIRCSPEPGIVALVGLSGRGFYRSARDRHSRSRVLIFHGAYEESRLESLKAVAQELARMRRAGGVVDLFEVNDNHDFNYPASRAQIYSAILNALTL